MCMCVYNRVHPHVPAGEVQTPTSPQGVWPLLPSPASPSKMFLFLARCSSHAECFLCFASISSPTPGLVALDPRASWVPRKNLITTVTK